MKKLVLSLFILCTMAVAAFAQERTVTGTIKASEDGLPIPGASVKVKEAPAVGATTGVDGKFTLRVPANGKTLLISYLGYNTQEVAIPANNSVNVSLTLDSKTLDQVVVTAGGLTVKRREQGYTSTTLKAQELTQAKATNVATALNGKVAGLQINTVSSGVNPTVRLVLRGNRSLLGNNQALVVVDNNIVPNSILGNLNPEDIEDMQVLNGAGAAALYGSDASNGALIITTKKGKRGESNIKVSNTTSFEQVSFYPKMQKQFGSGSAPDVQTYLAYENQQYGPAFDGSMVQIGKPLVDGRIQTVPYTYNDSKYKFWDTGITNQTDFAVSSGDEKSTTYAAGQYVTVNGTTPEDKYNRFSARFNGTRDLGNKVTVEFNTNYVQNRYDITSQTSSIYDQILQTPGQIQLNSYKNWQTDPFASPDGYYNEYYNNPYFTLETNRSNVRNDYFIANSQVKWNPIKELNFIYRVGITTQNASNKDYSAKYALSAYTKSIGTSGVKKNDRLGSVSDGESYSTQLTSELLAQFNKTFFTDLSVTATAGVSLRNNKGKSIGVSASSLVVPGIYNIGNRSEAQPSGSESNSTVHQQAIFGNVQFGYKNYLYLQLTGRNDWYSTLSPANRSVFYPSANLSFIATEFFPSIKSDNYLNNLKIRAGVSKVGNVNLAAYSLVPTFSQQSGYPYGSNPGFGLDNRIVSLNLTPEITKGFEGGFDADFWNNRISTSVTYYKTKTSDQIVPVNISNATGYTSFLINTGDVSNEGIETTLSITPVRTNYGLEVTVGGNYTYNSNKVLSISLDQKRLGLSTGGTGQVYAAQNDLFPVLYGATYKRDDQGRVIVDPVTGYPSANTDLQRIGNTNPKHILGLNTSIRYKQFRLAAVAEYRGGYVIFNSGASGFDFSGSSARSVTFNRQRFVFPNSSYKDPVTGQFVANTNVTVRDGGAGFWADGSMNMNVTENYVNSGAFWKIREISLSWDMPKSLLKGLKYVKGATISAQGRNLFLFVPKTNLYTDPDYTLGGNAIGINTLSQTPPTRYYGATLSLTF
ncbi:SusC/RagA family TonB-linked outer membrane protein [Pedobacter sp. KR3-3]|uniref:SusC/RagA family TonB-linked outer membrane protein n=1 Tax=Pedobacter albus TaxID=3113905 RepID=A0ABU7IBK3_9SPHI|nr:SusC/RagA family TonB-linked outer membrane protein [Pedobacter sp. KR3-3]MEE1946729.1 SusC/RagA family TonB-linked outer membrane protein [Pedobacter sp. KR3-3]